MHGMGQATNGMHSPAERPLATGAQSGGNAHTQALMAQLLALGGGAPPRLSCSSVSTLGLGGTTARTGEGAGGGALANASAGGGGVSLALLALLANSAGLSTKGSAPSAPGISVSRPVVPAASPQSAAAPSPPMAALPRVATLAASQALPALSAPPASTGAQGAQGAQNAAGGVILQQLVNEMQARQMNQELKQVWHACMQVHACQGGCLSLLPCGN